MTDWEDGDVGYIIGMETYGHGPYLARIDPKWPDCVYFTHLDGTRIETSPKNLLGPYCTKNGPLCRKDEFLSAVRRAKHAKRD